MRITARSLADCGPKYCRASPAFRLNHGFVDMLKIQFSSLRLILCLSVVAGAFMTSLQGGAANQLAKRSDYSGEVILLRGGFGVFSNGLDRIARSLGKRGVSARVYSHTQVGLVAQTIISNQKKYGRKPIILVGHSWGADSVIRVANILKNARLRVKYVATFAATKSAAAPSNIQRLSNYYFSKDGWGKPIRPGPGFRGRLKNIDLSKNPSINHFNIDENPKLQRQIINNVLRYIRPGRRG